MRADVGSTSSSELHDVSESDWQMLGCNIGSSDVCALGDSTGLAALRDFLRADLAIPFVACLALWPAAFATAVFFESL